MYSPILTCTRNNYPRPKWYSDIAFDRTFWIMISSIIIIPEHTLRTSAPWMWRSHAAHPLGLWRHSWHKPLMNMYMYMCSHSHLTHHLPSGECISDGTQPNWCNIYKIMCKIIYKIICVSILLSPFRTAALKLVSSIRCMGAW